MTAGTSAVEVFYSYAHEDEALRDELAMRLDSLRRQGLITQWHDRRIVAGTDWAQDIDAHLSTASLILLLISPAFMASTYCSEIEMKRALERHAARDARVIPIILRPLDWSEAPFASLQALPTGGKAVTTWSNLAEAFYDITIGIRRAIEDWTTPASSTPAASEHPWNVPYPRNPFFTGQETLLASLSAKLKANLVAALTQPLAISGLGGVGKTQIAVEYAYRHRDEYRAVLWARADSRQVLVLDFVALARLLHLPEKDEQDQTITVAAVKHWLDTHDQWLLILDNADDVTLVRDMLPSEANGHLLLTTRSQRAGAIAQNVEVAQMGQEDGILLLLKRAGLLPLMATLDQAAAADRATAEELVQALGGLPLALDQAGAYISETGCGVSGYLERSRIQRLRLLKRRGTLVTDYPETVATTWSLSFEQVQQVSPAATELLNFCAFLHPDAIPEELITEGTPDLSPPLQALAGDLIALDEVMEALRAYSLVRRSPETKTLALHRLVQAVLRDGLPEEHQHQWAERAVRVIARVFPDPQEVETWTRCQRYILHAQTCATWIDQWKMTFDEASLLLNQAGYYLREHAQYEEAEPLLKGALAIREQVLGATHPLTAQSLNNLALLYQDQGKYEQAEPLLKRALAIREQVLGATHPNTATSLNNLALLYRAQGKYEQAEPLLKRALAIYEQVLGATHPLTAQSLNNLALLYQDQGKYEQAEPLLKGALAIYEQLLGATHPLTATSLNNLALLYQDQGDYEQAEPFLKRAMAISEQMLGATHPDTATSLNNLAALYQDQGDYEQAEPFLKRAMAIREQVLGATHPDTAQSLNNLALLYRAQGKYEQAEPLYQRALAIREQVLGATHPLTATSLNNLAALYQDQGKYEQAEPLYRRTLAICEQVLGATHPLTATSLNNLALLYQDQGKYEQAEPLLKRALAICEQVLGATHPNTATSLNNLAGLYRAQGKYEQAEPLLKRALAIYEQLLGATHPLTATSLNNLAALYQDQGDYEQAEPLYQRALQIREQVLGATHPHTVQSLENYAALLREMNRVTEARKLEARAKTIRAKRVP